MKMLSRILGFAAACLLAGGCSTGHGPANLAPAHQPGTVQLWVTSADGTRRLDRQADLQLLPADQLDEQDRTLLTIDAARRMQSMVGFGAAMTDASAKLFQNAMPRAARDRLFAELFGRDGDGLGLSLVRVPIGASDFSTRHYSLDDVASGERDPALAHFSMAGPDEAQVPALRAARKVNPHLVLMASPWSAPAWMKDTDSLIRGRLRTDAYAPFADYLSRYLSEMARRGLPIDWLTIQNEPNFEPDTYPGMRFDPADRARFDGRFLGPLLAARHQHTRILDWDHNWDHPEQPLAVLADPQAARYVSGVAWHCYAGEAGAMQGVQAALPGKDVFLTECSGGEWAPDWGGTLGWMIDSLVIAPTRYGSRGTLLWNLALDENRGPHLGGCGDCRAVVTIDSHTGQVMARNVEYYVLGQASRFVRPGARYVASDETDDLFNAAFANPDGLMALLVHNRGKTAKRFAVRAGSVGFRAELPAGEVATYLWR